MARQSPKEYFLSKNKSLIDQAEILGFLNEALEELERVKKENLILKNELEHLLKKED